MIEVQKDFDERKELERLRRCIANPPENSRVFMITPNMTPIILEEYNIGNRPEKRGKIKIFAEYMMARRWQLDGNSLKFSRSGKLLDGQNRLKACLRAGTPFTTHVVFGLADDIFDTLDQGKNRSGADALAVAGYSNSVLLAGAVRWVHLIETGRAKSRESYPQDVILRLVRERYTDLPELTPQPHYYRETAQPPSLVMAMIYLLTRANPTKAEAFLAGWRSGQWGGKFSPIGNMQSVIAGIRSQSEGRVHETVRAALIIMAWNLFVAGRRGRAKLHWVIADDFPRIESG